MRFPCVESSGESFIRPFARAAKAIHSINAPVVGVNLLGTWYSADLIRNDPFLEEAPIVVAAIPGRMTPEEVGALQRAGNAQVVTKEQLGAFGLANVHGVGYFPAPFHIEEGPSRRGDCSEKVTAMSSPDSALFATTQHPCNRAIELLVRAKKRVVPNLRLEDLPLYPPTKKWLFGRLRQKEVLVHGFPFLLTPARSPRSRSFAATSHSRPRCSALNPNRG